MLKVSVLVLITSTTDFSYRLKKFQSSLLMQISDFFSPLQANTLHAFAISLAAHLYRV